MSRDPPRRLELEAGIELPGQVSLEYLIEPRQGGVEVTQRCRFEPEGLRGRLYWRALQPAHVAVFKAMLALALRRAERRTK